MKTVTITSLIHNYKDVLYKRIPKSGILVTRSGDPLCMIKRYTDGDKEVLNDEVIAKAEESVRKIKYGTFEERKVDKLARKMGVCSRCSRKGEVVEKKYVNKQGVYDGKWLGLSCCFNGDQGVKDHKKVLPKETVVRKSSDRSDFGGSNEQSTF